MTRRAVALVALAGALAAYVGVWALAEWRDPAPVAPGLLAQPPGGAPPALGPADAATAGDTAPPALPGADVRLLEVAVPTSPGDATPVVLDAALAVPEGADADAPVPAVVLLHGFGGDRTSLAGRAAELVADGYAVLLPSARGSGASGGTVTLADRDREGRDVAALVDVLAAEPAVRLDAPGDPRVALAGLSYGGGIALVAAGLDPRVDAVVAVATWHDLADALAPDAAADGATGTGPLKVGWTSVLFASRTLPGLAGGPDADGVGLGRCGRFDPEVCDLADRAAVAGRLDPAGRARLAAADVTGPLPPTLLVQGVGDTLFGVGQALANARVAAGSGAPVRLRLVQGEHGEASAAIGAGEAARDVDAWLDRWLRGGTDARAADGVVVHDLAGTTRSLALDAPEGARTWTFDAGRVDVVAPAGGLPAALTTFPGLGAVGELADLFGALDVPGQYADLTTDPLDADVLLLGGGEVTLAVSSTSGEAQLFLRLAEVAPGGAVELVGTQVAPARLTGLPTDPAAAVPVTLRIPPVAHLVDEGSRVRLTLATTDQGFANLREPATVTLDLSAAELTLRGPGFAPAAGASAAAAAAGPSAPPVALAVPAVAVTGAVAVGLVGTARRRRRPPLAPRGERLAAAAAGPPPVAVRGLTKVYDDGTRAVDGLDLTVAPGQVVGLLGPNGAGKTSALRMLLGLMAPTSGSAAVFGEEVRPGHPVLERVGALVAGPGLAPDLSGRDNLELFWRAGGRPLEAADLPWALEVADLGTAIDRPVRTYSHGMRQRLAIAQALLGRPELLVLDEPTDGLDPEQIRRMRRLLARLGAEGHAILVSSHLLAEVEQTCTHAVVMDAGRAVAAGTVAELGERARTLVVEVDDRERAAALLSSRLGSDRVALEGAGVAVALDDPAEAADVVAALVGGGLRVASAARRGRLEDVFLQLTGHGAEAGR